MKNNNHKLKSMEGNDIIRSRSASNGVNNKIVKKVREKNLLQPGCDRLVRKVGMMRLVAVI